MDKKELLFVNANGEYKEIEYKIISLRARIMEIDQQENDLFLEKMQIWEQLEELER